MEADAEHQEADADLGKLARHGCADDGVIEVDLGTVGILELMVRLSLVNTRTALILVGPALDPPGFRESALYSTDYDRRFRPTRETVLAARADGDRR